jgi:hypothetical protein
MSASDYARYAGLSIPLAHRHPRTLSRRTLLKAGVATTAIVAASGFGAIRAAAAGPGPGVPRPVAPNPNLFGLRVYGVAIGEEPSTITDFNGMVGGAFVAGTGVGTNTATGATETLISDVDMRFMKGVFRGTDGRVHQGTYTLI